LSLLSLRLDRLSLRLNRLLNLLRSLSWEISTQQGS